MRLTALALSALSVAGAFAAAQDGYGADSPAITSSATYTETRTVFMVTTQTKTGTPPAYNSTTSYEPSSTSTHAPYETSANSTGMGAPPTGASPTGSDSGPGAAATTSYTGAAAQYAAPPFLVAIGGLAMAALAL